MQFGRPVHLTLAAAKDMVAIKISSPSRMIPGAMHKTSPNNGKGETNSTKLGVFVQNFANFSTHVLG